jgi:hypothetical protein
LRQLKDILTRTASNLDAFTHPRVSIAWQDTDLVYRRVHNQSNDILPSIIGLKLDDIVTDKDELERLIAEKRRVLKTGRAVQTFTTIELSGKKHVFDTSLEPTRNEAGEIDGIVSISIDITDLETAREELAEANRRLMQLLDKTLKLEP